MEDERSMLPVGAVRRILNALGERERSVSEITRVTGLSQPNVSNHLARLRQRGWVTSRRHGRQVLYSLAQPPGTVAGGEKEQSHPAACPAERPEPVPILPALAAEYLAALLRLDETRAAVVVDEALSHGFDWRSICQRILVPSLIRVGELWAEGELSVAEEHAATAITTRLQERLSATIPAPAQPVARGVVAGVQGNLHALGGRIVADYLAAAGWEAYYLGTDLPPDDLLAVVQRLRPDAVLLSGTMVDQLPALRDAVTRLHAWRQEQEPPSRLPLLVAGGRCLPALCCREGAKEPVEGLDLYGADPETVVAELTERLKEYR